MNNSQTPGEKFYAFKNMKDEIVLEGNFLSLQDADLALKKLGLNPNHLIFSFGVRFKLWDSSKQKTRIVYCDRFGNAAEARVVGPEPYRSWPYPTEQAALNAYRKCLEKEAISFPHDSVALIFPFGRTKLV